MSAKSRTKGATFERDIAADLRRSLGDGWTVTRAGTDRQRGQAGDEHAGEFVVIGPARFPFAIECKAVETFDEGHLWRKVVPRVTHDLWRQARRQADAVGLHPLLVVKRNLGEPLAVMRSGSAARLFGVVPTPALYREMDGDAVTVVRWADVVERARWSEVMG